MPIERKIKRERGGVETSADNTIYAITFSPLMDSWDIIYGGKVCGLGYYNGPSSPRIGKLKNTDHQMNIYTFINNYGFVRINQVVTF